MSNKHIIKKQILDFTLDSNIGSFTFQSIAGKVFKKDIIPIIEAYLDELLPGTDTYRIDKIEIDLGQLNRRTFQFDFKNRMYKLFPQKLIEFLNKNEFQTYISYNKETSSDTKPSNKFKEFELLVYFIKNGLLPWWVKQGEIYEITEVIEKVIINSPENIKKLIIECTKHETWIKRFVQNLSEESYKKILSLFYKQKAKEIYSLTSVLGKIFKTNELLKSINNKSITCELRIPVLLDCINRETDVQPCNDRIIQNIVERLARIFNRDYRKLFKSIENDMKKNEIVFTPINRDSTITNEQVINLNKDIKNKQFKDSVFKGFTTAQIKEYVEKLQDILKALKKLNNFINNNKNTYDIKQENIKEILNVIKEKGISQVKNVKGLKEFLNNKHLKHLNLLSEIEELKKLNEAFKSYKKLVTESINNIESVIKEIQDLLVMYEKEEYGDSSFEKKADKLSEEGKVFTEKINKLYIKLNLYIKEETQTEYKKNIIEVINSMNAIKDIDTKSQIIKPVSTYSTFSDSEEIYISNSGLVLIWPYINHFFELLGLVENKDFIDETKREKGVFILQYLVSREQETYEYELALNKIFCGVSPYSVVRTDFRLTEIEKDECEKLIKAIILNWHVLKNMSGNGLRDMFLKREGYICARDGNWLLRVEEKSQDILIDRMPWSINTIKLPWMEKLLCVEWRL